MGMFDSIIGDFFCPYCGKAIGEFQTKDLDSTLAAYRLVIPKGGSHYQSRATFNMHNSCDSCKRWVEIVAPKAFLKLEKDVEGVLK